MQSVAIDLFHTANLENPNDLNHDGRVDAFDLQVIPVAGGGRIQPNVLRAITPQAGMPPLAAAAVDEALSADTATDEAIGPPTGEGLGGLLIPIDGRVGDDETTERDLAFVTFAATGDNAAPGELRMTLVANELTM